ncbi:MAG TPA: ATP-binding cassette domain-containing protein, partial [Hyphomicrobiaceae bacterium]|nr:ATP-binding cassette domain-containing protein [Hyphomicrobiaceae bacterium]
HMSVYDNMAYGLRNRGVPKADIAARVAEAARLLAIEDFLARKPRALSGGQRQRVAMGRAIVREPQAFLFDEPLSNLDAKLRVQMRVEIRRLHNRLKATSIFVTHDQVEAMTLADLVVVMNAGRIEQTGGPTEVYRQPATRFVATFIGSPAMNLLPGRITGPGTVEIKGGRMPFRAEAFAFAVGQEVDVGVRPEDLVLSRAGAVNGLPFARDFVEELGATRLIHGNLGEVPIVVAVATSAEAVADGAIAVEPAAVHLFDRASGSSLRRGA